MESIHLAVQPRTIIGKQVKSLRNEGLIPAELYGHGTKNEHLTVSAKEFNKVFKTAGSSTMVMLDLGKEKKSAMIHDIYRDSVKGDIMHVDFYQVRMDEKITARVPIEFVGESPAVKEKNAVINHSLSEVEVEAFPQDIPHAIVVDLGVLTDFDQSIYVKDLAVPKGVEIQVEGDTVVATATEPLPEEVAAPVETVDMSAIKTEGDEKKAERDADKATKEE
ncbi:MAG: 50S ribosomal protein L25 [Candidatus Pacebacteria bacterium]|nr:50S ribosomal protein L25 [Candidatus Paceibacterota bacterium]